MKLKIVKPTQKEAAFYFAYTIFLIFAILNDSFYGLYVINVYKYAMVFCILFPMSQEIINGKLNKKNVVSLSILILISVLLLVRSTGNSQYSVVCMFVFLYYARQSSFERIARYTILISVIMLGFIIISSYLGFIENYLYISSQGRVRRYLGFRYALYAPAIMLNITMIRIYLKKDNIKYTELIALFCVNYWLYYQTNSRLSFYVSIFLLIVGTFYKWNPSAFEKRRIVNALFIPSYIVCFALSILMTVWYTPSIPWMRALNEFLGRRLYLGKMSLLNYGISLLGQNITWIGAGLDAYGNKLFESFTTDYNFVDNVYIIMLQRYGIIFLVIYIGIFTALLYRCYKKNDNLLLFLLTILAVHGLIDNLVLYLHYNTFWLIASLYLFTREGCNKQEESHTT